MLLSVRPALSAVVLAAAILFGPVPLAQADPAPAPVPPSQDSGQPQQRQTPPPAGARGLAVRLPIRLGLLPLRVGRLAF